MLVFLVYCLKASLMEQGHRQTESFLKAPVAFKSTRITLKIRSIRITSQDGLNEDRLCFMVREWNWVRVVIHGPEITYFEYPISTKRESTQAYFTSFTKCEGKMVGLESCQESNIKNEVNLYYSSKWSLWSLIIIQYLCERTLW